MELAALTSLYSNVSDSDDDKDDRSTTPATSNATKQDGEFGGSLEYVSQPAFKRAKIQSAPEVQPLIAKNAILHDPAKKEIHYNPRYEDMSLPVIGPIQPFNPHSLDRNKNCWTGRIDETDINHVVFDMNFIDSHRSQNAAAAQERKRKREERGDPGTEGYLGPWAKYDVRDEYKKLEEMQQKNLEEFKTKQQQETLDLSTRSTSSSSSSSSDAPSDPSDPSSAAASVVAVPEFKRKHSPSEPGYEKTIFHGTQLRDYQGRTYMSPPSDQKLAAFDHASFLPKKKIHTWTGHTKGVQAIRMLPGTAHLLLSGGLDGKVKLWDLYNDRHVLRTFNGHSKGIKDLSFSNDGRRFLTASADSWIKLWDTETGQCITQLSNEKVPFCCKFNPDEDKQNEFLTGCNDKKIYQWDLRTKETIQEYNRHLNTVNSITFIDNNRRFVSTSDDKMIRVWEYGIPVDIKLISDPSMHSMPFVAVHPSGKWMACQSMDNQILLYSTNDRFKLNRKKRFSGHIVSGYACQIHFSPDGRFVISGDASGNLFIWDWKSAKIYKKIQCHRAVTIGCLWHPHEPSRVITCSWDGCIHYWD